MFPGNGETADLAREFDWSTTSLGPPEDWSLSLKAAAKLTLTAGFPSILLWGPALVQIYNDGYRDVMGNKHPVGMGQPTRECWPEVWDINEPIYARVLEGETLTFSDRLYQITRNGYFGECLLYPLLQPGV